MERAQKFYGGVQKWLTEQTVSADKAKATAERIESFGAPLLRDQLGRPARLGVTGKADKYGDPHLWLYLLWHEPFSLDSLEQTSRGNEIGSVFANTVALPSRADKVFVHLEFVSPSDIKPSNFSRKVRDWSRLDGAIYLGMLPQRSVGAA